MAGVLSERGFEVLQAAIEFPDRRYADRLSRIPPPSLSLVGVLPADFAVRPARFVCRALSAGTMMTPLMATGLGRAARAR